MNKTLFLESDEATRLAASKFVWALQIGDVVLLEGPLGAGKTTFVRGCLEALGHVGPVRSPTFNLIQLFATTPPVMHADLYRVSSTKGIGLEEYLESHLCFIEWPDRAIGLVNPAKCWQITFEIRESGRLMTMLEPSESG